MPGGNRTKGTPNIGQSGIVVDLRSWGLRVQRLRPREFSMVVYHLDSEIDSLRVSARKNQVHLDMLTSLGQ